MVRPPSYEGSLPFIFVSYSHQDWDKGVGEAVHALIMAGYRVAYDEGIAPGENISDRVRDYISRCTALVAFLSDYSVNESLWVRREIQLFHQGNTSLDTRKLITVRLGGLSDETYRNLPDEIGDIKSVELDLPTLDLLRAALSPTALRGANDREPLTKFTSTYLMESQGETARKISSILASSPSGICWLVSPSGSGKTRTAHHLELFTTEVFGSERAVTLKKALEAFPIVELTLTNDNCSLNQILFNIREKLHIAEPELESPNSENHFGGRKIVLILNDAENLLSTSGRRLRFAAFIRELSDSIGWIRTVITTTEDPAQYKFCYGVDLVDGSSTNLVTALPLTESDVTKVLRTGTVLDPTILRSIHSRYGGDPAAIAILPPSDAGKFFLPSEDGIRPILKQKAKEIETKPERIAIYEALCHASLGVFPEEDQAQGRHRNADDLTLVDPSKDALLSVGNAASPLYGIVTVYRVDEIPKRLRLVHRQFRSMYADLSSAAVGQAHKSLASKLSQREDRWSKITTIRHKAREAAVLEEAIPIGTLRDWVKTLDACSLYGTDAYDSGSLNSDLAVNLAFAWVDLLEAFSGEFSDLIAALSKGRREPVRGTIRLDDSEEARRLVSGVVLSVAELAYTVLDEWSLAQSIADRWRQSVFAANATAEHLALYRSIKGVIEFDVNGDDEEASMHLTVPEAAGDGNCQANLAIILNRGRLDDSITNPQMFAETISAYEQAEETFASQGRLYRRDVARVRMNMIRTSFLAHGPKQALGETQALQNEISDLKGQEFAYWWLNRSYFELCAGNFQAARLADACETCNLYGDAWIVANAEVVRTWEEFLSAGVLPDTRSLPDLFSYFIAIEDNRGAWTVAYLMVALGYHGHDGLTELAGQALNLTRATLEDPDAPPSAIEIKLAMEAMAIGGGGDALRAFRYLVFGQDDDSSWEQRSARCKSEPFFRHVSQYVYASLVGRTVDLEKTHLPWVNRWFPGWIGKRTPNGQFKFPPIMPGFLLLRMIPVGFEPGK